MTPCKIVFVGLSVPYEKQNWTSRWALRAHYPSLVNLKDSYQIVGILNSTEASAQHAINMLKLNDAKALTSLDDFSKPDLNYDAVAISVKVPHHVDYVIPALNAGKRVLCEWPLLKNLEEAQDMVNLAQSKHLDTAVALQARFSPGIRKVKSILKSGILGRVFSSEFSGVVNRYLEAPAPYVEDKHNGANVMTIPFGHCIDAVLYSFSSSFKEISGKTDTLFGLPTRTAPDYVSVQGVLTSGTHLSGMFRAGIANGLSEAFRWEIHGDLGDLLITSDLPYLEFTSFKISYTLHSDKAVHQVISADVNYDYEVDNIHRLYEAFQSDKSKLSTQGFAEEGYPTFEDALALHKLLNAINISSETGERIAF